MGQGEVTLDSGSKSSLRNAKLLVASYLGLSVITYVAIILLRNHSDVVNAAVWVRATIVVATSLLMFSFVRGAGRGSSKAYLRLRLASAIMVVAIAAIISLPGTFPVWLKIEQGVCGLILIGVVVVINSKQVRAAFAK